MTNETNFDAIDLSGAVPAKEPEAAVLLYEKSTGDSCGEGSGACDGKCRPASRPLAVR